MHGRLVRWVNRLLPFNFKISHIPGKDIGFTELLFISRLPLGKLLPPSYYDEEFVVASIDKIQKFLSNKDHFNLVNVNSVDRPLVAVKTNTLVNSYIPSGVGNSSDLVGQDPFISSLTYSNVKIFVAIISCIAQSKTICNNFHLRAENCSSKCLPLDNSKYNYRSNVLSDKVILHFIIKNKPLNLQNKKKFSKQKKWKTLPAHYLIFQKNTIFL